MTTNTIATAVTKQFGVKHPIFLAGMHIAASPRNCAAVTNAGGIGVLGGATCKKPSQLEDLLVEMKGYLNDPDNAVFGVDLLLPKVGEGARKTNKAYHQGDIFEFLKIVVKYRASLLVTAIGAPTQEVADYLHANNVAVMSMIGSVTHLKHLLSKETMTSRVDLICCQGGEGGGHTGTVPTSLLIPTVVDATRGYKSTLTGQQIPVVAAGGMFCGRSLVAALSYGASAIWVGTRFVASEESGSSKAHKQRVLNAQWDDTTRTVIYTGRPCRVYRSNYVKDWENTRTSEIQSLTSKGVVPYEHDLSREDFEFPEADEQDPTPYLMGVTAAVVKKIQPAAEIVDEIMAEALEQIRKLSKLPARL